MIIIDLYNKLKGYDETERRVGPVEYKASQKITNERALIITLTVVGIVAALAGSIALGTGVVPADLIFYTIAPTALAGLTGGCGLPWLELDYRRIKALQQQEYRDAALTRPEIDPSNVQKHCLDVSKKIGMPLQWDDSIDEAERAEILEHMEENYLEFHRKSNTLSLTTVKSSGETRRYLIEKSRKKRQNRLQISNMDTLLKPPRIQPTPLPSLILD